MAESRKVIITCAVTGSIHTPTMSPNLPVTPAEIAEAGIQAAQAGAAILHLHARNPEDGRPTQDPSVFAKFLPVIHEGCDAVINITTGGSAYMTVEERLQPALKFGPEVASLNMGSMNFGLFPMLRRFPEFQHEWEREHLENSLRAVKSSNFIKIGMYSFQKPVRSPFLTHILSRSRSLGLQKVLPIFFVLGSQRVDLVNQRFYFFDLDTG